MNAGRIPPRPPPIPRHDTPVDGEQRENGGPHSETPVGPDLSDIPTRALAEDTARNAALAVSRIHGVGLGVGGLRGEIDALHGKVDATIEDVRALHLAINRVDARATIAARNGGNGPSRAFVV